MKLIKTFTALAAIPALALTSCNDEITIPSEYISADFASNVADQAKLTGELSAFTAAQKAADGGNVVSLASMTDVWDGTDLLSNTVSDFVPLVEAELPKLALASAADTFDWMTAPNNDGGHFENRVFNSQGLESVQLTEKGLFGAALYYQAKQLVEDRGDDLSAADVDGLVQLFGANPSFPNSDAIATSPDVFQAKYAARRTPASGGMYLDMKAHFIEARAYAEEGEDYDEDKAAAVASVMEIWEKSLAATTINYLHTTIAKLSQTDPDDATIEDGMHAYAEGVGFFTGLLANPAEYRSFTNAEGESVLANMNAPFGGTPTSYLLVQQPATELAKIQTALDELQAIYGFTNDEMEGFKKNWVIEEGR